ADAPSDDESDGVRTTQPAAMHSANIGILAANRILILLTRRTRGGCRAQCSGDATYPADATGPHARRSAPAQPDRAGCAIARLRDCVMRIARGRDRYLQ